jgi:NAD-dependent deacetylase
MRSEKDHQLIYPIEGTISLGDRAEDGAQLRPHIVWFEEPVPMMEEAVHVTRQADFFVIVGTSLAVYPAAGLVNYAPWEIPKFIVDKKIPYTTSLYNLTSIELPASQGLEELKTQLRSLI